MRPRGPPARLSESLERPRALAGGGTIPVSRRVQLASNRALRQGRATTATAISTRSSRPRGTRIEEFGWIGNTFEGRGSGIGSSSGQTSGEAHSLLCPPPTQDVPLLDPSEVS
eukprot:366513-Pyramimonas_sp.AAC.1